MAPALGGLAWNKAEVAGSGLQKSASWSDFDTKPVGNKAASARSIELAAKMEDKAKLEEAKLEAAKLEAAKLEVKAKLVLAKLEVKAKLAAAKLEGKAKQEAARCIGPAAKVEGKPKPMPVGWIESRPKPVVISAGTERLDEDFIQSLRTRPIYRVPKPLPGLERAVAMVKENEDMFADFVRQHDEKGYALAWVEHLDNGRKRLSRVPEEETNA